jgi:hypothetical protein
MARSGDRSFARDLLADLEARLANPQALLNDLAQALVANLVQTVPVEGGTLREGLSEFEIVPLERGRWRIGVGDQDVLNDAWADGAPRGTIADFVRWVRGENKQLTQAERGARRRRAARKKKSASYKKWHAQRAAARQRRAAKLAAKRATLRAFVTQTRLTVAGKTVAIQRAASLQLLAIAKKLYAYGYSKKRLFASAFRIGKSTFARRGGSSEQMRDFVEGLLVDYFGDLSDKRYQSLLDLYTKDLSEYVKRYRAEIRKIRH